MFYKLGIMRVDIKNNDITKFTLLIIVIIIFTYLDATAQESNNHKIGFHLGIAQEATRDNLVSPLFYSGIRVPIQFYYKFDGQQNKHLANLSFSSGEIDNSVNNWADNMFVGLSYGYHRYALSFLNNDAKFFIGGILDNYFSYRNYYFRSYHLSLNYYSDNYTWELISSINLSLLAEYEIDKLEKIEVQIIMPVIAYVSRPSYSLLPPDNILRLKDLESAGFSDFINAGSIETIDEYFLINILAAYEINISDYFNLRWNYSFRYYSINKPIKTKSVINEFGIDLLILL
jgi:hypothetical protein